MELLKRGKADFCIEVPFQLYGDGSKKGPKPLLIYLHGYKQNSLIFSRKMEPLHTLDAWHLYLQGPYSIPLPNRKTEEWGAAWYKYDGDQDKFADSLEKTSIYIQQILDTVQKDFDISQTAVIGYSMGGYQAGYFAFSRPEYVDHLVVISARIKTELFKDRWSTLKPLSIFAVHGNEDQSVKYRPQEKMIRQLQRADINASLKIVNAGHHLDEKLVAPVLQWLIDSGY